MMNKLASMTELSQIISSRTQRINDFLTQENLPQPSLAADGSVSDFLPAGNKEIQQARLELRDATNQLHLLTAGTDRALFEQSMVTQHDANTMRVISAYHIPQHVPLDKAISYAELSQKCGLDQGRLQRILRYTMTMYVFQETANGEVAHTSLSAALATSPVKMDWVSHIMEDMFPVTAYMVDGWQKWPGSDAPNHTGFHLKHSTDLSLFEWYQTYHPPLVTRFANAMTFYSSLHEQEVLDFDWKALGPAMLIDIGGGNGHKAAKIARTAPQLRCVVQDLEATIKSAPTPPDDLQDRFTYQVYDFLTPQPQTTADVFLFARIFHDWSDETCVKILNNLVPSMKKGARLMLNDAILLPPNEGSVMDQRSRRSVDVHMMVALNAKERTLDEWKNLVNKGSDGKLVFEFASGGALLSFIKS